MNSKINSALKTITGSISRLVLSAFIGLTFVSCDGRTTQSLCNEATLPIPGITGTYETNMRNQETFGIDSSRFTIDAEKGSPKYSLRGSKDDEEETIICNVGGHLIAETFDRKVNGYFHAEVFISQVGIHASPLLFDKQKLDQSQIPNSIKVLPPELEALLGTKIAQKLENVANKVLSVFADESGEKALFIDNTGIPAQRLLQHSKPMSVGLTIYRL